MKQENDYLEKYLPKLRLYIGITVALVTIFLIVTTVIFFWGENLSIYRNPNTSKFSEYGGFVGGLLASLFSFFTFILLLITYYNQKADSEKSQILNLKTLDLIKKQNFEDTFFQMVGNLNTLINNTRGNVKHYPGRGISAEYGGLDYFENALREFINWYKTVTDDHTGPYSKIEIIKASNSENKSDLILKEYNKYYDSFYSKHNDQLGHIFRYIHNILKFSEEVEVGSGIESKQYINILQSQLSDSVLTLLFYNSISNKSLNSSNEFEFRNRLDKYNFFQNLRETNIVDQSFFDFFPNTVFRNREH